MSLLKLLFQSADGQASLLKNEEDNLYVIKLRGEITDKDFKKANNELCKAHEEDGCRNILFDLKEVTKISLVSRTWYTTKYLPQYVQKHGSDFAVAIVEPINLFERQMIKLIFEVASKYLSKTTLHFSLEEEDAYGWFRSTTTPVPAKTPH